MCADLCKNKMGGGGKPITWPLQMGKHQVVICECFYYFHIRLQLKCHEPPTQRGPVSREPWQTFPAESLVVFFGLSFWLRVAGLPVISRGLPAALLEATENAALISLSVLMIKKEICSVSTRGVSEMLFFHLPAALGGCLPTCPREAGAALARAPGGRLGGRGIACDVTH